MDGYPLGSLDHNVPLLIASGLLSTPPQELPLDAELKDQAVLLRSDLPPLDTKEAKVLAQYLGDVDSRQDAWNGRDQGNGYKFKVTTAGRVHISIFSIYLLIFFPCWRESDQNLTWPDRHIFSLPVVQDYLNISNNHYRQRCYTLLSRLSARLRPCILMASLMRSGYRSIKSWYPAYSRRSTHLHPTTIPQPWRIPSSSRILQISGAHWLSRGIVRGWLLCCWERSSHRHYTRISTRDSMGSGKVLVWIPKLFFTYLHKTRPQNL
jgi:hypothetical protein